MKWGKHPPTNLDFPFEIPAGFLESSLGREMDSKVEVCLLVLFFRGIGGSGSFFVLKNVRALGPETPGGRFASELRGLLEDGQALGVGLGMDFGVWGLGVGVWGLGFGVWGLGGGRVWGELGLGGKWGGVGLGLEGGLGFGGK